MKNTALVKTTSVATFAVRAGAALLGAALVLGVVQHNAHAQAAERSGKEIVDATCANCHATGEKGAPKIGDKAAWSKLSEQSLSSLTAVALKGIRQMPPHGANMKLSDTEIKRAVTYMVNQSGGNWVEPASKSKVPAERTGEQVVKARCGQCHEKGLHGAPKIGDADAWIPRVKNGLDTVVRSAINGHGGMQARGGMANLTDNEMRNAIIYMMNRGRVSEKDQKK
jgi:cytochrome c5